MGEYSRNRWIEGIDKKPGFHHAQLRFDRADFKQDHDALFQQYFKTTTRRVLHVGWYFELEMLLEKSNIG